MPATETPWYNQKLLHVIFGCTSLVMLIATIWMVAQDHERSWKEHQRDFRSIQLKQLKGRMRAEEKAQNEVVEQAAAAYAATLAELPDADLVEEFKKASAAVDESYSFDQVNDAYDELKVESSNSEAAQAKPASWRSAKLAPQSRMQLMEPPKISKRQRRRYYVPSPTCQLCRPE